MTHCIHMRPEGVPCPHCLGINDTDLMPQLKVGPPQFNPDVEEDLDDDVDGGPPRRNVNPEHGFCMVCWRMFTNEEWDNRHTLTDGLNDVHAGCCELCMEEDTAMLLRHERKRAVTFIKKCKSYRRGIEEALVSVQVALDPETTGANYRATLDEVRDELLRVKDWE